MELGGDEKRIRVLFSELSIENQSSAPQFAHVWTRAQVRGRTKPNSFRRPVLLTALLIVVASSLAVWSWYRFTPSPPPGIENLAEATPKTTVAPVTEPERSQPRRRRTRRRQTDRRIANEAALLSRWQSPTQSFMSSPTVLIPGSLPRINQSVKDLETFLPKDNEIMKESNQ